MNELPENRLDDPLLEHYRQASQAEAGHPSRAARSAIRAEARAAALRRTPAANDARWTLRAVATLAIVGLGASLWFAAGRPELQTASSSKSAPRQQTMAREMAAPPTAPPPVAAPPPATVPPPAPRHPVEVTPPAGASSSALEQAQRAAPQAGMAKVADAATRFAADAKPARAAAAASALGSVAAPDYAALFPEAWQSEQPPRALWVVLDAGGKPLASGELRGDETFAERFAALQRERPGLHLQAQSESNVRNARGVEVRVAIARAAAAGTPD